MNKGFTFNFDLFDFFEGMCLIINSEGKIFGANKVTTEKLKVSPVSKNLFDFLDDSERDLFKSAMNKCIRNRKSLELTLKFSVENKNLYFHLTLSPYKLSEDGISSENFYLVIANDITQKKENEEDLQRFFYVAENTVNPLQITDTEGKMIYVNPAFLKVSGYTKEELIGNNPSIFGSKKQLKKFWSNMWTTIKSGKTWIGDVENRKKNGEPFHTQLLVSPILDNNQNVTGYFGIHRDLSEVKTLEKQLIHTQKMESIGTLAAGIAHEVGNPLASISALVQVAQRFTTDNLVKEKLELVKNQVNRISKIIRDLVDFSRPSNYEFQLTDINRNLSEAVDITKVGVKAKDIVYDLILSKEIPLLPLVADQVQQVFVNILLNATDAILESRKKEKKIAVRSELENNDVIITFSDSGIGIAEENIPKIFEPFFTTKKEGKGTGLGLWVSYGIIKSFHGDIKVSSTYNKGTTFTIILPVQK